MSTQTYLTIPQDQLCWCSSELQHTLTHFDCYRNPWNNSSEYTIPAGTGLVLQNRHPEFAGHRRRYPMDIHCPSRRPQHIQIDTSTGHISVLAPG